MWWRKNSTTSVNKPFSNCGASTCRSLIYNYTNPRNQSYYYYSHNKTFPASKIQHNNDPVVKYKINFSSSPVHRIRKSFLSSDPDATKKYSVNQHNYSDKVTRNKRTYYEPDPTLVDLTNAPPDFDVCSAVVYSNIFLKYKLYYYQCHNDRNNSNIISTHQHGETKEFTNNNESTDLQRRFVSELEQIMKQRRRYEQGHWDAVITNYKEIELSESSNAMKIKSLSNESKEFIQHIQEDLLRPNHLAVSSSEARATVPFLPCHVIDLHPTLGELKPHVDSVRFSGSIVAGLSLKCNTIMRLRPSDQQQTEEGNNLIHHNDLKQTCKKEYYVDLLLPMNSLYILSGMSRYDYTHELLPASQSYFRGEFISRTNNTNNNENCNTNMNRISVIFRDAKLDEKQ